MQAEQGDVEPASKFKAMTDPVNSKEWQSAVDTAHACLAIDSARKYGLVTGGPTIHVERCVEILQRGADKGFTPAEDAIERFIASLTSIQQH